ncbi:MAG: sensor histidine kinase [Intrasporangium sp.]|uniref:sensor histidine kinase n=1 Tax=Intrasporangium sp. TaxID=1925024 RepID=UPI0026485A80|nr:sensor histidine kinase [Intrasporangium sp.]MDN5796318.1 sensor histidine kinase [Intrasporangium sp.]
MPTEARDNGALTHRYTWPQRRALLIDGVIGVGLWFLFLVASGPGSLDYALIGTAQTLPLALRRRTPTLVFTIVTLACALQVVTVAAPMASDVGFLFASYALAAYGRQPTLRWAGLGVGIIGGFIATLGLGLAPPSRYALLLDLGLLVGLPVMSWFAGDVKRSRLRVIATLEEQNAALRRDRDQRARLTAQSERARIAREMHDIVAHSLSVVVVQADGAAYAAEHAPAWTRSQASVALQTIGTTAREALDETRRLVGVLRESGDGATEYAPTASLDDMDDLIGRVRSAGHEVELDVTGSGARVPREVELAAYRIIQEALTNVLKHAGPAASVRVSVTRGDPLVVEVEDDGRGAAATDDGSGNGTIGMRERAAATGGTLKAGPRPGGGYRVRAELPLTPRRSG